MIAVIFEVMPKSEYKKEYLDLAADLKTDLLKIEGFISIERFTSLNDSNRILSLSFWEDENAVIQWRNLEKHREAQKKGRKHIFSNYRLRVASVLRDYGMEERAEVPDDSRAEHG